MARKKSAAKKDVFFGGYGGYGSGDWWGGNTTAGDLQQEMTGTVGVFGRDRGISVSFSGEKAETRDGAVIFPVLDQDLVFEPEDVKLFRGWVDSEAAIARFSDRPFIAKQAKLQETNLLLYDVFKAVETSRVEGEYAAFYPGAGKNLSQLSKQMFKQAAQKYTKAEHFFPTAISMFARGRMQGVFNYYDRQCMADYVDTDLIEDWVDEIQDLSSAEESFELARRIVEYLEQNPQPQPIQNQPSEGGDADGDGDDEYESISASRLVDDRLGQIKREANTKVEYDPYDKDGPYLVYSKEMDEVIHWSNPGWDWPELTALYMKEKEQLDAGLAAAKKKLELMIQATQKISWDTMKERGRLDSRRLVGAYQGEPDVFKVKRDESDLDTAVALCVDLSGSMSESRKSHYAFLSTMILSELLAKVGVPFEITGFTTKNAYNFPVRPREVERFIYNASRSYCYAGRGGIGYARLEPLLIYEFKRFGDRFFDARKYLYRIATLENAANNNIDGESIQIAAKRLAQRPEKRRILLVLSDGQPHGSGLVSRQHGHLQRVIADLEKRMEVVGIGLCSDAVRNYYTDTVLVKSAQNLPATLLDLLGKKLLPQEKSKNRRMPKESVAATPAEEELPF